MADSAKANGRGLRGWLEDLGEVESFGDLAEAYQRDFGPLHPHDLRRRLWNECGVAVNPRTLALVLPEDWPAPAEAGATRH